MLNETLQLTGIKLFQIFYYILKRMFVLFWEDDYKYVLGRTGFPFSLSILMEKGVRCCFSTDILTRETQIDTIKTTGERYKWRKWTSLGANGLDNFNDFYLPIIYCKSRKRQTSLISSC